MQKSCKNDGCNRKLDKSASAEYCSPCSNAFRTAEITAAKRLEHSLRQRSARERSHSSNRNVSLSPSPPPTTEKQPSPTHSVESHQESVSPGITEDELPVLEMDSLLQTYSEVKEDKSQPKILTEMFGLMIRMASRQKETDTMKEQIKSNSQRLDILENKLGGPDEITEKLGLAVRNMPLPEHGKTELDNIRTAFHEIHAPGVDVNRDVIKAVRRVNPNNSSNQLGTVMVEVRCEKVRSAIMKNKQILATHSNPNIKGLKIQNAKSQDRMFAENCTYSLIKMSLGDDYFIAGNGMIRRKSVPSQPLHNIQNYNRNSYVSQNPSPVVQMPNGQPQIMTPIQQQLPLLPRGLNLSQPNLNPQRPALRPAHINSQALTRHPPPGFPPPVNTIYEYEQPPPPGVETFNNIEPGTSASSLENMQGSLGSTHISGQ